MQKTPHIYFLYIMLARVRWLSFVNSYTLLRDLDHFLHDAPKRTHLLFASLGMEITITAHFKVLWRTSGLFRHCLRACFVNF